MTALAFTVLAVLLVVGVLLYLLTHPRQETTMPTTQERPPRAALADLHAYVVPVSPKMLLETLCVAQHALNELEKARPGYQAGGTIASHQVRLQHLIDECQRMRPTGPDGKHGDRHTPVCGCKR